MNIGDIFYTFRGESKQLHIDAQKAGDKAGQTLGERIKRSLSAANIGTAIGAGLGGLAVGALKLADTYDRAMDTIRTGTGATGDALADLEKSFKSVAGEVPDDIDVVSTVLADLNTRTGQTGEGLETLAKQILDLSRITRTDAATNVANLTRLYGDWSVATEDQAEANDLLFRASQATGIGIDKLASSMVQFGAPLRNIGMDLADATAMLAKWEKEGVNTELALGGLKIALGEFAKEGIDAKDGLEDLIDQITNAEEASVAMALGVERFGSRAGPDMVAAIREGRFEFSDFTEEIETGEETIASATEATEGFGEQFRKLKNQVAVAVGPIVKDFAGIAEGLGNAVYLLPALGGLLGRGIGKAWTKAGGPAVKAIIATVGAAGGLIYRGAAAAADLLGTALQSAWLAMGQPGSRVIRAAIAAGRAAGIAAAAAAAAVVLSIALVVESDQPKGVEAEIARLEREIERFNKDNLDAQAEFARAGVTYGDILRGMELQLEALIGGHIELAHAFRDGTITLEEFETALGAVEEGAATTAETLEDTGDAAAAVVPPLTRLGPALARLAAAELDVGAASRYAAGGWKAQRSELQSLIDKARDMKESDHQTQRRLRKLGQQERRLIREQATAAEKGQERVVAAYQTAIVKNREMQDELRATLGLTQAIRDMRKIAITFTTNATSIYDQIRALFNPPPKPGGYDADPRTPWPMAEGGIVTRPTLALLGERGPEAVVPLSQSGLSGSQVVEHHHTVTAEGARNLAAVGFDTEGLARLLRADTTDARYRWGD